MESQHRAISGRQYERYDDAQQRPPSAQLMYPSNRQIVYMHHPSFVTRQGSGSEFHNSESVRGSSSSSSGTSTNAGSGVGAGSRKQRYLPCIVSVSSTEADYDGTPVTTQHGALQPSQPAQEPPFMDTLSVDEYNRALFRRHSSSDTTGRQLQHSQSARVGSSNLLHPAAAEAERRWSIAVQDELHGSGPLFQAQHPFPEENINTSLLHQRQCRSNPGSGEVNFAQNHAHHFVGSNQQYDPRCLSPYGHPLSIQKAASDREVRCISANGSHPTSTHSASPHHRRPSSTVIYPDTHHPAMESRRGSAYLLPPGPSSSQEASSRRESVISIEGTSSHDRGRTGSIRRREATPDSNLLQVPDGNDRYLNLGPGHQRVRRHRSLPSPFMDLSTINSDTSDTGEQSQPMDPQMMTNHSHHARSSSFRLPNAIKAIRDEKGTWLVTIRKTKPLLGLAIEGGANIPMQKQPRIISIHTSGAAFECNDLRVGHIILEVNGNTTADLTHDQVARLIAHAYYHDPSRDYIEFRVREKHKSELDLRRSSVMLLHNSFGD